MTPPSGQKEAFSRVVIDAQLKDVGWDLTDGHSVRYEYQLPDGTEKVTDLFYGAEQIETNACPVTSPCTRAVGVPPCTGRYACQSIARFTR